MFQKQRKALAQRPTLLQVLSAQFNALIQMAALRDAQADRLTTSALRPKLKQEARNLYAQAHALFLVAHQAGEPIDVKPETLAICQSKLDAWRGQAQAIDTAA